MMRKIDYNSLRRELKNLARRQITTWHPNFDSVPVPVLSLFWAPEAIISSTSLRYRYSSCLSNIIFGRNENLSTSNFSFSGWQSVAASLLKALTAISELLRTRTYVTNEYLMLFSTSGEDECHGWNTVKSTEGIKVSHSILVSISVRCIASHPGALRASLQ